MVKSIVAEVPKASDKEGEEGGEEKKEEAVDKKRVVIPREEACCRNRKFHVFFEFCLFFSDMFYVTSPSPLLPISRRLLPST